MIPRASSTTFILKVKLQTGGPVKIFTGFSKKSHFRTFWRPKMAYEVGPNLWTWIVKMNLSVSMFIKTKKRGEKTALEDAHLFSS